MTDQVVLPGLYAISKDFIEARKHPQWPNAVAGKADLIVDLTVRERQLLEALTLISEQKQEIERGRERDRKLALILDQSVYGDSLGVMGSDFSVCRWCGGGSGPGGNPSFKHNDGCLMDDDELQKQVAYTWEDTDDAEARAEAAEAELNKLKGGQ